MNDTLTLLLDLTNPIGPKNITKLFYKDMLNDYNFNKNKEKYKQQLLELSSNHTSPVKDKLLKTVITAIIQYFSKSSKIILPLLRDYCKLIDNKTYSRETRVNFPVYEHGILEQLNPYLYDLKLLYTIYVDLCQE